MFRRNPGLRLGVGLDAGAATSLKWDTNRMLVTVRTMSKQQKGLELVVREVGHLKDRQD